MLLFTADVPSWLEESYCAFEGFSHHGERREARIPLYPWVEDRRTIYFFARSRRDAARQLESIGVNYPCNLSDGRKAPNLEFKTLLNRKDG